MYSKVFGFFFLIKKKSGYVSAFMVTAAYMSHFHCFLICLSQKLKALIMFNCICM